jgi:FkbM family methyltransferase
LNYPLNADSVVFDLGGYEGKWSDDIYSKYKSKIYIFEPAHVFYENIRNRFLANSDIKVFNFGLAKCDSHEKLFLQANGSSIHLKHPGDEFELIELRDASKFLHELGIKRIDLVKINIEGGEYDLLEHLIDVGYIKNVINIQVQFHDFVDNAVVRMKKIQDQLSLTHELTYQYDFVWENWKLKNI